MTKNVPTQMLIAPRLKKPGLTQILPAAIGVNWPRLMGPKSIIQEVQGEKMKGEDQKGYRELTVYPIALLHEL